MKVAYFAESLEKDKDGVARVIYKMNDLNNAKNVESLYITSVPEENSDFNYFKTKSVPIPGYDGYRMSVSSVAKLTRIVQDYDPDLIHLHAPFAMGRAATLVARNLQIPCVSTYHTHFASYLKYHKAEILEPIINTHIRQIYNNCDLNLIPSNAVMKDLEDIGVENMEVLPHGVDNKIFNQDYFDPFFKTQYGGKTLFLYVGRLVWEKNLRLMAEVFNQLYSNRYDFELLIVGTGPAEEELKQILPKAQYLGFKKGKELSTIYASCDALIFPSDTETFGNVTLEAMASGICVLVADGGGSVDIVNEGKNGLKFHPHSFSELYQKANLLLDDPFLRLVLRSNALDRADKFTWEAIHTQMLDYYKTLIEGSSNKYHSNYFVNSRKHFFSKALLHR